MLSSRVVSPNHAIATRTNIDQTVRDLNPGFTIIARDREDIACAVDPHTLVLFPAEIAVRVPEMLTQ